MPLFQRAITTVQEEGAELLRQRTINIIGQNAQAVDNPITGVTDLRIVARHYDAIVTDEAVAGSTIPAFTTIQAAIDSGAIAIFVRAGFQAGFTILSSSAVTRIVGETPGGGANIGVRVNTDVTLQKDDVLLEQILWSGLLATMVVNVEASGITFLACAWAGSLGTSTVDLNASATDTLFVICQARGNPSGTGWVTYSGAGLRTKFVQCTMTGYSGGASIIDDGGFNIFGGQISACSFLDNTTTAPLVDAVAFRFWNITGNSVRRCDGGAFDMNIANVAGNTIDGVAAVSGSFGIRGDGIFSSNLVINTETGIIGQFRSALFVVASMNMVFSLSGTPMVLALDMDADNIVPILIGNLVSATTDLTLRTSGDQIIQGNLFFLGGVTGGHAGSNFVGNVGHGLRGPILTPQVDDEVNLGTLTKRFAEVHTNDATIHQNHIFPERSLVLVNGNNDNLSITDGKFYRITGPTAAFAVRNILSLVNGREMILYNSTAFDMTISDNAPVGFPNTRILTLTGADVTLTAQSVARLIYSDADAKWILIGTQG